MCFGEFSFSPGLLSSFPIRSLGTFFFCLLNLILKSFRIHRKVERATQREPAYLSQCFFYCPHCVGNRVGLPELRTQCTLLSAKQQAWFGCHQNLSAMLFSCSRIPPHIFIIVMLPEPPQSARTPPSWSLITLTLEGTDFADGPSI